MKLADIPVDILIKLATSNEPVTYADIRRVAAALFPGQIPSLPGLSGGFPVLPNPVEPPILQVGPNSHIENIFHDWFRDSDNPEDGDMSSTEEVAEIVSGQKKLPPPPATLWVQCDAEKRDDWFIGERSRFVYNFQFNNGPVFSVLGHELVSDSNHPHFKVNGWRKYNEQNGMHLLVRVLPEAHGGVISFWCSEFNGTNLIDGPKTRINVAGRKQ